MRQSEHQLGADNQQGRLIHKINPKDMFPSVDPEELFRSVDSGISYRLVTEQGKQGISTPEGDFYAFGQGEEPIVKDGKVVGVQRSLENWLKDKRREF